MDTVEGVVVGLLIVALVLLIFNHLCVRVYRFYRPTCPACVASQVEWELFKSDSMFRLISPIEVNMDLPENKQIGQDFNITSVPTVLRVKYSGANEVYYGERTAAAYMAWALS